MVEEPTRVLIEKLKQRYAEPQRAYHTWDHIDALLNHFNNHRGLFDNPTRVLWALYWHDVVYDPTASDNELKSAELLRQEALGLLKQDTIDAAAQIIEATEKHQIPNGTAPELERDMALFLDIDLSILGQSDDVFDTYEAAIRQEYSFVPEQIYRTVRSTILKNFLDRDRLYFTDEFQTLWEAPARDNLARSIGALV